MAGWSEMNAGTRAAAIAVVALLFGGGYEVWKSNAPQVPVPVADQAGTTTTPAADPNTAAATPAPTVATATPAATPPAASTGDAGTAAVAPQAKATAPATDTTVATPAPKAPTVDVLRVDPDGATLIAGQVEPGAAVSFMVDGVEVATAVPDASGKFVAQFTLPPSTAGRLLTMIGKMPDGKTLPSPATIALAATEAPPVAAAPVVTAAAGTTAPPAASAEPAPDAGTTALAVTDQGVKVLQSGADVPAEVAANVSLETIAYPSPDTVQFGGHGAKDSFVRLYVDNAALGQVTAIAPDRSWTITVNGIAPALYTLRVDQLDQSGKVTSRFETPFKRETPEALAALATKPAPGGAEAAPAAEVTAPTVAATTPATAEATPVPAADATTAPAAAATTAPAVTAADTTAPAATADAGLAATAPVAARPAPATTTADAGTTPAAASGTGSSAPAPDVAPAKMPQAGTLVADGGANAAGVADGGAAAVAAPAPTVAAAGATGGATATATADATPVAPPAKASAPVSITVQPGYTLWGIAKSNMGEGTLYVQVWNANKASIKNPDLIYPGQVFTMPARP